MYVQYIRMYVFTNKCVYTFVCSYVPMKTLHTYVHAYICMYVGTHKWICLGTDRGGEGKRERERERESAHL